MFEEQRGSVCLWGKRSFPEADSYIYFVFVITNEFMSKIVPNIDILGPNCIYMCCMYIGKSPTGGLGHYS